MLKALVKAAQAVAKAVADPNERRAMVEAARAAKDKLASASRGIVQGCKVWQRNRVIRQAYNARKRVLDAEIKAMKERGASKQEMAELAQKFRHDERMLAREEMIKNGDADLVEKLQARDLKKYGNKDGPTLDDLVKKNTDDLRKTLGREPTPDEVHDAIVDSATRTDWATNLKFLSF